MGTPRLTKKNKALTQVFLVPLGDLVSWWFAVSRRLTLVGVTVMGVRKVSVAVLQRVVAVRVLVRDARRNVCRV